MILGNIELQVNVSVQRKLLRAMSEEQGCFNLWATREALNQIPNDYTLEVTNRTKGLDMIDKYLRTMHEGSWRVQ